MSMDVVCIKGKKAIHRNVDFAAQPALDAFTYHRALLAWYGEQVRMAVGRYLPAKSHIKFLSRPIGTSRNPVSKLQMFNAERPREIAGRLDKDTRGVGIVGSGAAVDA